MRPYNDYGAWVSLDNLERKLAQDFMDLGKEVETHWQAQSGVPQNNTIELLNVSFNLKLPSDMEQFRPTQPWASDHFDERVSRVPHNPPPSASYWRSSSATKAGVDATRLEGEKFSHTYPERFWPKKAGRQKLYDEEDRNWGIRYPYGDLDDVVSLLAREPYTRQAYLPVWFPEDTGAVPGERVPCTLGYHFILRDDKLHCFYPIRSCDFLRHWRNDLYFAGRLTQWVLNELREQHDHHFWGGIQVGRLHFHAVSFHIFNHVGDLRKIQEILI